MSADGLTFVRFSYISLGGPYAWFRTRDNRLVLQRIPIEEFKQLLEALRA